jgi:hypothetical protein
MKGTVLAVGFASMEHTSAYRTFGAGFEPRVGHPHTRTFKDGIMTQQKLP